jgi:urea carboxylase-associated protein 2
MCAKNPADASGAQDSDPCSAAPHGDGCLLRPSSDLIPAFSLAFYRHSPQHFIATKELKKSMSLWEDTIQGGASWSVILRRGNSLRLEDIEGGSNVGALFYNWDCMVERYNMPDTLKAQHIAHLTSGFVLYSDMGRILASITADSCGWHDPLGGHNDAKAVAAKYGKSTYQESRNAWHRNTHDCFLVEAAQYGLSLRDIGPNVNFFSKVLVDDTGAMNFVRGNSKAGDFVELRAEMNLLIILASGQHPLDPNPNYAPNPIRFSINRATPAGPNDPCRLSRPENARGFINTERYFL